MAPSQHRASNGGAATANGVNGAAATTPPSPGFGFFAARAHQTPPPPPLLVLITGAAPGGIGHALARDLASRPGVRVIATARRKDQLRPLLPLQNGGAGGGGSAAPSSGAAARNALPGGIEACLELDVTSSKSIDACRKQVDRLTQGRGVDVLINNAGVNVKGTVLDTDLAALEKCMAVNFSGLVAVTKAFAPAMAARRQGLIVNLGSAAGYCSGPIEATYAASKAAVRALTDGLRVELAPLGVKVMLAAPGFVKTRIDDQVGRAARGGSGGGGSGGGSGGGGAGNAGRIWFEPKPAPANGEKSAAEALSSPDGFSPYALYGWMSRVVKSSIFELGPGVLHDSAEAFAKRLGDAVLAEAPRSPRPAPLAHRARVVAAQAAASSSSAKGGKGQQQRQVVAVAAAAAAAPSSQPAAFFGPLPPPSLLDLLLAWSWWAPTALGGPRRHFRAAPFAGLSWLMGMLAPLWLSDLALAIYMGFVVVFAL
jgi:short-subunit dehydrogenase